MAGSHRKMGEGTERRQVVLSYNSESEPQDRPHTVLSTVQHSGGGTSRLHVKLGIDAVTRGVSPQARPRC
jgi:hypothetical protein